MKTILSILGLTAAITSGFIHAGEQYYAPSSGGKCAPECHTKKHCCPGATFYIFGFGGGTFSPELNGQATPGPALAFDLETGYNVGGGLGVRSDFLGGFRFEVEGFYGENDFDSRGVVANGNAFPGSAGSVEQAGFHFNFIKEFRNGGAFTPYIGIGVGYTDVSLENVAYGPVLIDDSDGAFSYQAIAGLEFAIGEKAGIYVEYNYHSVSDLDFDRSAGGNPTNFEANDFSNHTIQGGLRFYF